MSTEPKSCYKNIAKECSDEMLRCEIEIYYEETGKILNTVNIDWQRYSLIEILIMDNKVESLKYVLKHSKYLKYTDTLHFHNQECSKYNRKIGYFNIVIECMKNFRKWHFVIEWLMNEKNKCDEYLTLILKLYNTLMEHYADAHDVKRIEEFETLCPNTYALIKQDMLTVQMLKDSVCEDAVPFYSANEIQHMFGDAELKLEYAINYSFGGMTDMKKKQEWLRSTGLEDSAKLRRRLRRQLRSLREFFKLDSSQNRIMEYLMRLSIQECLNSSTCHPRYPNPLKLKVGNRGDISCDETSGYDSLDDTMNCWQLERWSGTDEYYYCLNECIECTWTVSRENKFKLIALANEWRKLGFQVFVATFTEWRKGYDYEVHALQDIDKYLCFDKVRFYVKKLCAPYIQ